MAKSVIFVLPKDSKRTLDESGWLFRSSGAISNLIYAKIINFLNVKLTEEFLGIKKYENEYTQANIVYSNKKFKEIYIRTSLHKDELVSQLAELLRNDAVDIFVPS
jgi:hypothetical protein